MKRRKMEGGEVMNDMSRKGSEADCKPRKGLG